MKGNEIIVASPKRGVEWGAYVTDVSFPGTAMEILNAPLIGGRPQVRHYQPSASGDPRPCIILLPDDSQGGLMSLAYAGNLSNPPYGKIYFPLPGEDVNIATKPMAGTGSANAFFIAERMMPDTATGQFVIESTSNFPSWFVSMEHYDAPVQGVGWLWTVKG
jgi:hypothetical protein